jgi:hypothetical protein
LDDALDLRELTTEGIVNRFNKTIGPDVGGLPMELADEKLKILSESISQGKRLNPVLARRVLNKILWLFGPPEGFVAENPDAGKVVATMEQAGPSLAQVVERQVAELVVQLIEQPGIRITGAEEAARQIADRAQRALSTYQSMAQSLSAESCESLKKILATIANMEKSMITLRRNQQSHELMNLFRDFPRQLYQGMLAKWLQQIYRGVLSSVPEYLRNVQSCRERLNESMQILAEKIDREPDHDPVRGPGLDMFPNGATTLNAAAKTLIERLNADDMLDFDRCLQEQIATSFGSLSRFCLDAGPRPEQFATIVESVGQAHIERELNKEGCVESLLDRGRDPVALHQIFDDAIDAAHPPLAGPNAEIGCLVTVIGVPPTPAGQQLRHRLESTLSDTAAIITENAITVVINRELQQLRLADLPQMGSIGKTSYEQANANSQTLPHSRFDIDWSQLRR